MKNVVILDYGSGDIYSVQKALESVGAKVEVSTNFDAALNADALVVTGNDSFSSCVDGIKGVRGDQLVGRRLAGGRSVLGIGMGMQVLFERSIDTSGNGFLTGLNEWPGTIEPLAASELPHVGFNTVHAPTDSEMFSGINGEQFYFDHSFAARTWELNPSENLRAPKVAWATYGEDFVAAVENGPLWATQFYPEKSGKAGLTLLANWISTVK